MSSVYVYVEGKSVVSAQQVITLASTIVRSDDFISSSLGDETVMMSLDKDYYFGLDQIGSQIWTLIEHPTSVSDLCAQLAASYDVDPDVCQQDTLEFLQEMYNEEMITIVETPTL